MRRTRITKILFDNTIFLAIKREESIRYGYYIFVTKDNARNTAKNKSPKSKTLLMQANAYASSYTQEDEELHPTMEDYYILSTLLRMHGHQCNTHTNKLS